MVIAGLAAKGVTEVEQVQNNIERGYETRMQHGERENAVQRAPR